MLLKDSFKINTLKMYIWEVWVEFLPYNVVCGRRTAVYVHSLRPFTGTPMHLVCNLTKKNLY